MDYISTGTDQNLITVTMNIDFSAAFDCVPHTLLKEKLAYYGFDIDSTNWLHSYLDHWSCFLAIGSARSEILSTPYGVPQGSVLGPMLYLLFVNEMTSIVEDDSYGNEVHSQTSELFSPKCDLCGTFPIYADDGEYQISSNSRDLNQDKIENNFFNVYSFLSANGLQVNASKTTVTEYMSYQKRT